MIVLGITETHCATAAILRDGAIVGCASEERFTRLKNDAGYPRRAIDALLRELSLTPRDIDLVALAGTRAYARDWMNRVLHDADYARQYYGVRLEEPARGLGRRARKLGARLGLAGRSRGKFEVSERDRLGFVTDHLGLDRSRIVTYDHHLCHAAAAYYGSPFAGARALVLTNDNAGDGLCASVSTGRGTALVRHEAVPSAPGSLGSFYSFVTLLLGMKFGEHEYKVMGLAPYAPAAQAERAYEALSAVFGLDTTIPARFVWKRRDPRYRLLLEATLGLRFDAIAAGAQRMVEESLLTWARLMRERHGGERLALGGGVFMNVKANGRLADEPWLRDLFVFPSCGDESNAVGAAYLGWLARVGPRATPQPFGAAYLVGVINRMIKNRDFWMPFAPSILRERETDYVVNPKGLASPYMMLAFATNPKRRDEIIGALHPHDATARAHLVDEGWNPGYHRVIREFERRTGIGAVLNTSFNLHGEPLVGSAEDALDTFERSGLTHLALDRWVISKK